MNSLTLRKRAHSKIHGGKRSIATNPATDNVPSVLTNAETQCIYAYMPPPTKLGILVKLDETQLEMLNRLATETRVSRSAHIREAIDDLIAKYKGRGLLKADNVNSDASSRAAERIRATAAVDVDALLASGDLVKKAGGWYALKNISVLDKLHALVKATSSHTVGGKSEIRVQLDSIKSYKALAGRLKPGT